MFCPECGNRVEASYKFCHECGFKLHVLSQTRVQDGATSAPQSSVTKVKKEKEEQDVENEQENTHQIKGQPAGDDSEQTSDGITSKEPSDGATNSGSVGTKTTASSLNWIPSDGKLVATPQLIGTCTEDNRPSSTASTEPNPASNPSASATQPSPTPASTKQTEQQTKGPSDLGCADHPKVLQIPDDKQRDIASGSESISSAPESSEQQPRECNSANQPASEQDKDQIASQETQNVSEKPENKGTHIKSDVHTSSEQAGRKESQAAQDDSYPDDGSSVDPCPVTNKTDKFPESVKKTRTHLPEKQEQQPHIQKDLNVSVKLSSHEGMARPVAANISEGPTQLPTSPNCEWVHVYFHAVTSNDPPMDPKRDKIFLMSEMLFGSWEYTTVEMNFSRDLGEKRYLVEGQVWILKSIIQESIPYKYLICKGSGNNHKYVFEDIYQKEKNVYTNRCLLIKQEFLSHEGTWHQYDDVIHLELKRTWFGGSLRKHVITGRDLAGKEMLKMIFDLLTTWKEQNVNNFFFQLRQFFHEYSCPLLHEDTKKDWELEYGKNEVEKLLKGFLDEFIHPNTNNQTGKMLLSPLHLGVVGLLVYYKYLKDYLTNQLSSLCELLCLPRKTQHHFRPYWQHFADPLTDKKSVADAVEMFCHNARQHTEKWVLAIPLIHLLRGQSKPFEPVPPDMNPKCHDWIKVGSSKGTHFNRDPRIQIKTMKEHAYLMDIDRLLLFSWMSLLPVDDAMSFISSMKFELLDILKYLQISIKADMAHSTYMALKDLASNLIRRESNRKKSFDDEFGEHYLKTAVRLHGSICRSIKTPDRCDVPLQFLDLLCLIAQAYGHTDSQTRERILEESIGETLGTIEEWRKSTFKNKLLNDWGQPSVPDEIRVWKKLLSVSFSHDGLNSSWRNKFMKDFEGKLKRGKPTDQIGLFCKMVEELSEASPLLCSTMEKCAVEAVAAICQNESAKTVSDLLGKHDITKFGKLMSVVVLKSWPTDANGDYVEGEELTFQHLLNWPMAKTVFKMSGERGRLFDRWSDEAQLRITLATTAFKSVSQKFLSGEIQMKTLSVILQREQQFLDLLKIDDLCDDGRCKDEKNMRKLLKQRKEAVEAVRTEKEMVMGLLQFCQKLTEHVKVDFQGLDEKLQQNIETMNLNEFMEDSTFGEQTSVTTRKVTFFGLNDTIYEMASEIHGIKDSFIFKMCWTNQVEELSKDQSDEDDTDHNEGNEDIYTLDLIYSKIFQRCYSKYKGLYDSLKNGELSLGEVDSIFGVYKGRKEDLQKELDIMCTTNPSDNRNWIKETVKQITQYQELDLAVESSQIIMDIRKAICPEADFGVLEKLLQMNEANFKTNNLNCIDDDFIHAKDVLKNITNERKECLQVLSQRTLFVEWIKKELEDINELKVFVDLASISAGENDMDVDRVACFHDAVLGYSSMLYGLKQDSDFQRFKDLLPTLWKALENDKELPKKLRDTARQLEWLKTVRESHGSVEFSSLSLATSINERGMYTIKAQNQKRLNLETSLTLQIQNEEQSMTCTYEDLKELQNKLMLMSGRGQQSEVEQFTEVFENVQRLAKAFVDLNAAGNPLFRCWEAKIYCKPQNDPCIIMEINFCEITHGFQVHGSLVEQLTFLSKKMELFLDDWQNFMDKQRSDHYYLNYFTAEQIFYLCSVVTPTSMDGEIEEKALMMLSFIKPSCTTSDVLRSWERLCNQYVPGKMNNGGGDTFEGRVSHFTYEDRADEADQTLGLKELEELWSDYMRNERMLFHDLLDIRCFGGLLQIMSDTENQDQDECEEPMLSEKKDNCLRRSLPQGLKQEQPNLLICPHDDVLTSSICLYMTSDYEPLPSYDEVLLCTPSTTYEQVELFLRRCLSPGEIGQKIYTMLWVDQLSYDVSCAMEKCYQRLCKRFKHDYRLVLFCSSEREHTYIPTAFSQYKRDFVPQESLEKIQKYISRHFTAPSDNKDTGFKGGHTVGIVASHRAGVGKSLYVQRLYEKMERNVGEGTAFKKCIRLTEQSIDDHKVLQSLFETPKQKDLKVFHFDVTSSVQKGLNEFLFKFFFLRYLMDSDGQMWHCSHKHLYIMELMEAPNEQARHAKQSGRKEDFAFSDIFPKVFCRPPKVVMALEMQIEEDSDIESKDPLMDDECFKSEAFQRPYQYLTRFHNKDNLDNFTYQGVEGTHAKCLQILLIHCGIIDPSWAELRNFVWFLNLQLQDCESSDFCNFELVGDTLSGFKNFVVEFMILMSKDFATPSLCIADQSPGRKEIDVTGLNEKDLAPFLIRKRWESEPHPYIFFNDDHTSMTFIGFHLNLNAQRGVDAINPSTGEVIKKDIMTRQLYTGLKLQRVPFNQNFDQLPRADKLEHLCSVLGIKWPTDPDETYELTTDNILKMMAIHMRFRCGIPVIIMGETGCGKTRLVKFMCELRRCGAPAENMKLVKVHGGTTSEIIHDKVMEAETLAMTNKENHKFDSVLFFDEANTTEAISSIKEILCDNSVQGQQLGSQTGLQIIAACNPYRKHTDNMIERLESSGLGYRVRAQDTEDKLGSIPLRQLVYRVHVLPPSMIPLVWDFGQLSDSAEHMYIQQIVQRQVKAKSIDERHIPTITQVLSSSQKFMRERKDECSFVSLRDVERCMQVFVWFHNKHTTFAEDLKAFFQQQSRRKKKEHFSAASDRVIWSLLMATAVCYQSCLESKGQYQETISKILPREYKPQRLVQEIQLMQDLLLNGVPMGKTIARNEALKENFFMMVICVELRIPLFIVGKPGSSKSLSKTLIADAMQGPTSHSELFKRLKQIHLVSFQCSPHSTPEGIINTFKQCARFQESKNLDEYISVVVLDEIGLAEDSLKMPLKALHPLLEEGCVDDEPQPHKRVGFIGISNWALDPAKMNRGIFVSRGDLDEQELVRSAKGICSSEKEILGKIEYLFHPFAKAYMTVCREGKGFFGLRDFYSLIKMIFTITKICKESPTGDQIAGAVRRNFSGKEDIDVIDIFCKELSVDISTACITTIDMVKQSITPQSHLEESRYLLILTKNYAALQILQQIFLSGQIHPVIIFGSSFPKDQEYMQICRNINRIKVCMETGQTVVLLNLQNLYESLYDALNQYYVTLGGQKYVDLGLGTHRVKCRVHQNFKLIVIEEKEVVYEQFPIPLINRLEKHYLDINTVLKNDQKNIASELQNWVMDFLSLSNQLSTKKEYVPSDVFIGYHSDTCSSVVLQVTENQNVETDAQGTLNNAKNILLNCATPDSVVRLDKSRLPDEERELLMREYFKEEMHSSLGDYIVYQLQQSEQSHRSFNEVTTFSRLLTAADINQLQNMTKLDDVRLLSLQQFDTEYSFLKKIREFLDSTCADKVLIVQTEHEEDFYRRNIVSSAKYSCINEINKCNTTANTKTFVYFVTKLPRMEGGTSYVGFQCGPWRSVHIDDLRRSKEFVSGVHSMQNVCISDLFEDSPEAMETEDQAGLAQNDSTAVGDVFDTGNLVRSCVQTAVGMLRDADSADSGELSTRRVETLLTLLDESQSQGMFPNIVKKWIHSLLKDYESNIPNPKSWVLSEASNVSALQEGGTFLHSLWKKIQAVVTPLLANLISVIDRDCNLNLLLCEEEEIRNLWLEIFSNKEILNVPYVRESRVLVVQSHFIGGNTMCCQMPFSWWIKDFLDGPMMQTFRHDSHSLHHFHELFLKTPLGSYMAKNVNSKMKKEFFERYLQDFVSMTMKVGSDDDLKLLVEALASCVEEVRRQKRDKEELSLLHIHIAFHVYRSRLQNLSRMISLHPEVLSPLRRNQHISHCPELVLDVYAAKACVECLECPNLDSEALCRSWLKQVKRLQASLELICSQNGIQKYGERCKEILGDISRGWKGIYIRSLFVEHMLLGFQHEDSELKALVLRHMKTLSKVLEGNSDVKSTKAFEAVIENLKSCKQGAVDRLFRFGPLCGVCMREPEDPVGLPCHHMFCSTCITASLGAGQSFCPTCRQQLPNDFQPCVSEDIRASLKKNGDFRRRCNGFFIDLLSTVCFKDNKPPTSGVITHLLSYLMIETENQQIHTKALSPFDESPDKSPVVRSVILKLLLKFSFDEVKDYLQQHLSAVENSRFVEDKAELYALYINCLEDSLWEKLPLETNEAETQQFYRNETQFIHNYLTEVAAAPATVSIQLLQHIARLRLTLTMAAQLICDKCSDNSVPEGADDFLKMVFKLCEDSGNDWYRVYLIRKMSERQGVEFVQGLAKQPEFSWLFPEEIKMQNEDGGHMDQYLVYGEEYEAVRDAVAKAVVDGNVNQIEEACERFRASPRSRTVFILLALFREVTTLYRSTNKSLHPTPEQCQAFGDLIQGSTYLPTKEVRDFASDLVHNRLGSLTIKPDHTNLDNTVIELVIHLAAVLLTGNHLPLMPLKQLGLFPENMQRAFIPTMPDDLVAMAQAAIPQSSGRVTWYVCRNNHPCFVGECGRPTERGNCLECGEEVGGEHHKALDGFKPAELQPDGTRPGHILGDPEQRNNTNALDTKTMSLTPFTLVRLATHLAMLLGASKKSESIQQIIQPPVEDVCLFLIQHIIKDLDQLTQALGKGPDDTITAVHLILQSMQRPLQIDHYNIDPYLPTKTSRNSWETTMATDIITPKLKDLDQFLQKAKDSIRNDSRVSSNFIMRITFGDCSFLTSLPQTSEVHSSAVWSCRERLSLLTLTHTVEFDDQKEELRLLWRFLQKEREFRQIKFLPDILVLQKHLVRKYQNASEQIVGSIAEFIEKQTGMRKWYEKHINIFLKTWNLLRVSVTSNEMKIPEEFCSDDLDLSSNLEYLLPRRQGAGLCATGLVSYLVALQNELVNAVDNHTGEDSSSYKVSLEELMEQHVICYDVEKDLLPLLLSNCQYSLECGHETISQYDLPRIQQQILTHILQGKPLITRTGIPTLVKTQERDYETIFKTVKVKVPQIALPSLTRNILSRELDYYDEVCEVLKIVELLLSFLSMTGGDPKMQLVTYLKDTLKMGQNIDGHILQTLGRCNLGHCISLWQLLSSLKSERMLHLKKEPFSSYPAEYQEPLTEKNKTELKGFMSQGKMDQWLLEMHEFILLNLGRQRSTDVYKPFWSVKEGMEIYMDLKEVEVPLHVEENLPENLQLSQIVETWKYAITARQEWITEG